MTVEPTRGGAITIRSSGLHLAADKILPFWCQSHNVLRRVGNLRGRGSIFKNNSYTAKDANLTLKPKSMHATSAPQDPASSSQ